ncbi:hypothetical protein [Flavobacterium caeni]|uniref:Uncharacterized protein n=1 Tax=Flavobacterium caeni TaxID=490189 RepID=A0A1G5KPB8_9FLAO|nr:hypothetical protein [Flavobacterium caeni]SCZ01789.1 hypothetical protein SAMN02927903_03387 [Flavobacterium caeni]
MKSQMLVIKAREMLKYHSVDYVKFILIERNKTVPKSSVIKAIEEAKKQLDIS